ncbi:hypothetical protein BJV74DRAFT_589276 [Russula compacta]|nr:hypothetical protein BJV74DRAFT_589276 [Russula compacta]
MEGSNSNMIRCERRKVQCMRSVLRLPIKSWSYIYCSAVQCNTPTQHRETERGPAGVGKRETGTRKRGRPFPHRINNIRPFLLVLVLLSCPEDGLLVHGPHVTPFFSRMRVASLSLTLYLLYCNCTVLSILRSCS